MSPETQITLAFVAALLVVAVVAVLLIRRKKDKKHDRPKPAIPSGPIETSPELEEALKDGVGWLDPNLTKK